MPDQASGVLRVLYSVAETHPNHRADIAALFGKYLPRLGVNSDLLTLHHLQPPPPWPGGQDLTRAGPARGAKRHLLGLSNDVRMLWLARRGYHALIVRDKSAGALIGLLAARLAGIPFVYWMSFPMTEAWAIFSRERGFSIGPLRWLAAKLRATLLRWLLYKFVLPRANHIFVQSDVMLANVAAEGVPIERLTAVPMGVDSETTPQASLCQAKRNDRPVFAYLGTLSRIRRPEVMIEAIALLNARGVNAGLLLVGDAEEDSDRQWVRHCIAVHHVEHAVEVTGWLPPKDGWHRCLEAIACLSPVPRGFLFDAGSPTKVVEYLQMGLSVIANDQPDQAALLIAAGGACTKMNAEAFADAMHDVIKRPAHYQEIAKTGQQLVQRTRSYAALSELVAHRIRQVTSSDGTQA
jgi:glycosyltransferase involved in cell wall biosynthesis